MSGWHAERGWCPRGAAEWLGRGWCGSSPLGLCSGRVRPGMRGRARCVIRRPGLGRAAFAMLGGGAYAPCESGAGGLRRGRLIVRTATTLPPMGWKALWQLRRGRAWKLVRASRRCPAQAEMPQNPEAAVGLNPRAAFLRKAGVHLGGIGAGAIAEADDPFIGVVRICAERTHASAPPRRQRGPQHHSPGPAGYTRPAAWRANPSR